MKMKNKNLTQRYDSKPGNCSTPGFKLCFCVFQFSFLAVCLSTSPSGAEASLEQLDPINLLVSHLESSSQDVNMPNTPEPPTHTARVQQNQQETQTAANTTVNFVAQTTCRSEQVPHSSLLISKSPNTHPIRQLWQARISASEGQKDNKSKNELQQIIKQIHSVEFKPQDKTPAPFIAVEPTQKTEPNKTLPHTEVPKESKEKKSEPNSHESEADSLIPAKAGTISHRTLQTLVNLLQHPEQLENPFELAEVLFRSRRLKEAAKCYREALSRSDPDEADSPPNRAWILFQTGNCLRSDNPAAAMETYRQLITEYPDSPWVDLAKARSKLTNWHQQNKPRMLIDENQQ